MLNPTQKDSTATREPYALTLLQPSLSCPVFLWLPLYTRFSSRSTNPQPSSTMPILNNAFGFLCSRACTCAQQCDSVRYGLWRIRHKWYDTTKMGEFLGAKDRNGKVLRSHGREAGKRRKRRDTASRRKDWTWRWMTFRQQRHCVFTESTWHGNASVPLS